MATVALDGAKNAGILAAQIIGAGNEEVRERIRVYKTFLQDQVMDMVKEVEAK